MEEYIALVLREVTLREKDFSEPVSTLYIGGGTPSLLPADLFRRLIHGLQRVISLSECREFTLEANPGTLRKSFLQEARSCGINRVSLGMQAAQDRILRSLGRIHSIKEVAESVRIIREEKVNNLNLDLIFGIPGQTISDWKETLDSAVSLHPEHISAYGLIPEEGTPLFARLKSGECILPDPEEEREMYDFAIRRLASAGYHQYEISNFALDGYECTHNLGYWQQVPYVGIGLSAASMLVLSRGRSGMHCRRMRNPDEYSVYQQMIETGDLSLSESEEILPPEARFESMMLSLRLNQGIRPEEFERMHGVSVSACYGMKLEKLQKAGLMKYDNGAWSLTRRGMDIQNSILVELMDDDP